jgi:hypothetical protein
MLAVRLNEITLRYRVATGSRLGLQVPENSLFPLRQELEGRENEEL